MSQSFPQFETEAEEQAGQQSQESQPNTGALAVSADDFSALEERILRAVELVKQERQARTAAEERAAKAETDAQDQTALAEQLYKEVDALKAERDHVRQRVERLLTQLDAIEL
jgi:hypothetical protein